MVLLLNTGLKNILQILFNETGYSFKSKPSVKFSISGSFQFYSVD